MFEASKPRYMTSTIAEELDEEIQRILWSIIDQRRDHQEELDYLQVFELTAKGDQLTIINRQEQPPIKRKYQYPYSNNKRILKTVWIIESGDYCIMLAPSDY